MVTLLTTSYSIMEPMISSIGSASGQSSRKTQGVSLKGARGVLVAVGVTVAVAVGVGVLVLVGVLEGKRSFNPSEMAEQPAANIATIKRAHNDPTFEISFTTPPKN